MQNKTLQIKTLRFRIKDKHVKTLNQMARETNLVWNYVNELSHRSIKERGVFMSSFDIHPYTTGLTKVEGITIGSTTVQQVADEYVKCRRQSKKAKLSWRVSNPKSAKKSLGWVPFAKGAVKYKTGTLKFAGFNFNLWDSYEISKYDLRSGNFSEDSRGRWYLNIAVETSATTSSATASVGVDLGLKATATTSDGDTPLGGH